MGVSAEVCELFLEKQNPVFEWKPNLMPYTHQGRAEPLARPPCPHSSLNSIAETHLFLCPLLVIQLLYITVAMPPPTHPPPTHTLTVSVLQHRAVLHKRHVPGPFCQAPAEEKAVSLGGSEPPEPLRPCPASTSGGLAWTVGWPWWARVASSPCGFAQLWGLPRLITCEVRVKRWLLWERSLVTCVDPVHPGPQGSSAPVAAAMGHRRV